MPAARSSAQYPFTIDQLRAAWAEVLGNDAEDGLLTAGVKNFGADLENELGSLIAELAWGTYAPGQLTEVRIPQDAGHRLLHLSTVRDRVIERAILDVAGPLVDPHLGAWSFGYRPGLGVLDAVAALVELREEGMTHVLRTDIDDCFPSIPVDRAIRLFDAVVGEPRLTTLVQLLCERTVRRARKAPLARCPGLPQGSPLSPLLMNLVLAEVDAEVVDSGFPIVRYADDVAVAAVGADDCREALEVLGAALRRLGMSVGEEDTAIMSFAEGFTFLGEDFGPRYPPRLPPRVEEPDQRVLYLGRQGSHVRIQSGRLRVESTDEEDLLDVPTSRVSRLVCFGSVGVSAGVRSWAMGEGVDVVFASRRGAYQGVLRGAESGPRADRLVRQLSGGNDPLALGRRIVEAKIDKQSTLLRRFGRRDHHEIVGQAVKQMRRLMLMLPEAQTREEIMGLEGAAAAVYFPAYGALFPEELAFSTRSRRPPLDIANSALSFLYTILLGECVTACWAAGLEPILGVLHSPHERRPSLALDLLEEFRPYVVDQVVLSMARDGSLTLESGNAQPDRPGISLTKKSRERLLTAYETRMLTRTAGALPDFKGTIRRHVYLQASRIAAEVDGEPDSWRPLSWR